MAALLAATAPAFAQEPALEEAVAQAARENKPLVIEFHAEWCAPCHRFEQNVLSRADVQAALEHVVFVRYDIDEGAGYVAAKQLEVTSVPTIIVLDALGRVTRREAGAPPAQVFLRWLASVGGASESTVELEAAVAAHPEDLAARRKLADHYRAIGRPQPAIEQLTYIAEHAGSRRDVAAAAAADRDAIQTAEARTAEAMAAADTFVADYPDSRLASAKLAALALSKRASQERLDELAKLHVDAVSLDDWPDAIRAALLAGADSVAHRSIQDRLSRDPQQVAVQLVRAEELVMRNDSAQATAVLAKACSAPGNELWCFTLHQTIDTQQPVPSRIVRMRDAAQDYLDALAHPESHVREPDSSLDRLGDLNEAYGNAVAIALAKARSECAHLGNPRGGAFVIFDLPSMGSTSVTVMARDGYDVEQCVRKIVEKTASRLHRTSAEYERVGTLLLFTRPRPWEPAYANPPRFGLMPELVVRSGEVETYGLRGDLLIGPRSDGRGAFLFGATLEVAGGQSGDPLYVARAVAGYQLHSLGAARRETALLAGIGVSDLGPMASRALEVPIEVRARVPLGRVRFHTWVATTAVFFSSMRETDDVIDELCVGAGLSFPIVGTRLFFGGAFERRAVGDGAMFTFGVPIGEIY